jgi:acyl-CoA thioesterase-1
MQPVIEPNSLVLFQGDSITDCGRSRRDDRQLGAGYVAIVDAWFNMLFPQHGVRFLNRGISGNRVQDMHHRWKRDALDLKPDWVSILIGINDTWRRYDSHDPVSTDEFEGHYRSILEETRCQTGVRIIILEPFLLPYPPDRERWREDLDPKIAAVRRLAQEFAEIFIPLDQLFAGTAQSTLPKHWLEDGVHPTPAGHAFIARAWLQAINALG